MLFFLFFHFCLLFVNSQDIPPYESYWFTQRLDHFNPQDTRVYEERYLVYDGDWDGTGPIFFYAGNEGPITSFWNNTGFMFDIAPEFEALVIFAEHRYYGESLPFGEDSWTRENLRYLTIENAIADYASFLTTIKQEYNATNSPVVVFGGSYGGVLAALCRTHYPAIFDMALAASAPIPQTLNTINGYVFFKLVTQDYYEVNPKCPDIVRQGYAQVFSLFNEGKYDEITDTFSLCTPLETQSDLTLLELWSRNAFLTMAMVDYPYAADFEGNMPAWPVNVSCDILLDNINNPMLALAEASGMYYNASADYMLTCFNMSEEYVECADQTGCGLGDDAISWNYQMCTEIVYAMDTNNITDMFPPRLWNLNNLTEYCNATFQVTPEYEWMQIWFPLAIGNASSRIIFSNGLLDPWHGGGYLTSPGYEMPAVIIREGAHHLDLRSSNPADPESVIVARKEEVNYIQMWLDELYRTKYIRKQNPNRNQQ